MQTQPKKVTAGEVSLLCKKLKSMSIDPSKATRGQICKAIGVSDRRARTLQEKLRSNTPIEELKNTQVVKGNTWDIYLPSTSIHTLEELLSTFEVDTKIWEVERFTVNAWEMGYVNKESGDPGSHQLYQVKAQLKKNKAAELAYNDIESLKESAKDWAKKYPAIKRPPQTGNMLEINIPDLHVNKLAWGEECGEDYDVKIAIKNFNDAVEALLERTSSYKFDQILFIVGNDLLHSDNTKSTTTAGTPQDTDTRFQKSFVIVRKMMTETIERLREVAPVKVLIVPGNHDQLSTWCLGDSLQCVFANCDDVEIDNAANFRKYHQFGKVMLMFSHGNKGKLTDYPLVMATEQPKMFGDTLFREAHTGDKHHIKVHEVHGVKVRIFPALCPPDAWHSENFYTGAHRAAEAFIWNKQEGLVGTAVYTVPKG